LNSVSKAINTNVLLLFEADEFMEVSKNSSGEIESIESGVLMPEFGALCSARKKK
jgi:hypothetical protein